MIPVSHFVPNFDSSLSRFESELMIKYYFYCGYVSTNL